MHIIPTELLKRHDYRIPNYIARSVAEIDFELLAKAGKTTVLIDVDNTLVTFGARALHAHVAPVLEAARKAGHIEHLVVASNSRRNLAFLDSHLHPDAVMRAHGLVMKPRRRYFREALHRIGVHPDRAVMIGDKLVQDVWGSRRSGLTAILVRPLGRDAWFDRLLFLRLQERWLLRRYLPHHREHWF